MGNIFSTVVSVERKYSTFLPHLSEYFDDDLLQDAMEELVSE